MHAAMSEPVKLVDRALAPLCPMSIMISAIALKQKSCARLLCLK
jgi:hypothetical protein